MQNRKFRGGLLSIVALIVFLTNCEQKDAETPSGAGAQTVVTAVSEITDCSVQVKGSYFVFSDGVSVEEVGAAYRVASGSDYTYVPATELSSPFVVALSGLDPATDYRVKSYIRSGGQLLLSENEELFTTLGGAGSPVVRMLRVEEVTNQSAQLFGSFVTADGQVSEAGFEYRTVSSAYTSVTATVSSTDFQAEIDGLVAETNYFVRAYVVIGSDTYYGIPEYISFKTAPAPVDPSSYRWVETPVIPEETDGCFYVTHFVSDNSPVRNYSLYYDPDERISYWVAYPMHPSYLGDVKRTDKWAYDPSISSALQPDLKDGSYDGNYSRGHQVASSDRTQSVQANWQTFYFTNMTPQIQNFNGNIWNSLEVKVQKEWICDDTLYVVSGAALLDGYKYTTDQSGQQVAVPSHYYKVLLRTKDGNTGKRVQELPADELQCVGFWFDHFASYSTKDKVNSSYMKSVAEIEELTGFTFFPEIPAEVKQQKKPSEWGM